jgi:AraC-like DNA-binding protein
VPDDWEAWFESAVAMPAPSLRDLVHRYRWFDFGGLPPGEHQGVPSRHVTVVFGLDAPIRIVAMPSRQAPGAFDAFVAGLHVHPATVAHPGHGSGVGLELTPAGARALLGASTGELAGRVVALDACWGVAADDLAAALQAAPCWAARVEALDAALSRRRTAPVPFHPVAAAAWWCLRSSSGRARIGGIAAEVGASRRHLSSVFRAEYGLTPKEAARVFRFERAAALLEVAGRPLAEVAARCGYVDQAHLTQEWRAISGETPAAWRSRALRDPADASLLEAGFPEVQDAGVAAGHRGARPIEEDEP